MQTWLNFLQQNLPGSDAGEILPIERIRNLEFEWIPENGDQFQQFIATAPPDILEGFGFVKYSTLPEGPYRQDQDRVNSLVGEGCELLLLPVEWYEVIPKGFNLIDISGKIIAFEPGETSRETRIGCLGYGVSVPVPSRK